MSVKSIFVVISIFPFLHIHRESVFADGNGEPIEVIAGDVKTLGIVTIISLSALVVTCEIDFMRFVLTGLCIEPYLNARVFRSGRQSISRIDFRQYPPTGLRNGNLVFFLPHRYHLLRGVSR